MKTSLNYKTQKFHFRLNRPFFFAPNPRTWKAVSCDVVYRVTSLMRKFHSHRTTVGP